MDKREEIIKLWFDMWVQNRDLGIKDIFSKDVLYIESWGPQYYGVDKVQHWFQEWHERGEVLQWDIKQYFHRDSQTVVEWYFKNVMGSGKPEAFDGMSLIKWTEDGKISYLQEFGCNVSRYDPYQDGPAPHFRDEQAMWF